MMNDSEAYKISILRNKDRNTKEREKFLDWINCQTLGNKEPERINEGKFNEILIYDNGLRFQEMWVVDNKIIKSKQEKFSRFDSTFNTRNKTNSETCLEIDKLDEDKSFNLICETIASLMRDKIHFAIFYAKGQRSPHIRIYDFDELEELNPQQRIKAQVEFWRRHIPFGCFQYADTGMFVDEHTMQLEFATHWKYGTNFELLFEHIPEVKNAKDKC